MTMPRLTWAAWERAIREAWLAEPCAFCGSRHGLVTVGREGTVAGWCPLYLRGWRIAYESPPAVFAPPSIVDGDLPF